MTEGIRDTVIRIKLQEMGESVDMVREHLPDSVESFGRLGIIKDGIYKRIEYAIENVFDICAIVNADLHLGVPATDEDILENLVRHGVFGPEMRQVPEYRRPPIRCNRRFTCLLDIDGAHRGFRSFPAGG
ncbi:MAG TPA: DUF86 domain-containing protein [Methanoculleus sp.]|nr:DUF86 domain-containing protein [Methanoculleus sp.]